MEQLRCVTPETAKRVLSTSYCAESTEDWSAIYTETQGSGNHIIRMFAYIALTDKPMTIDEINSHYQKMCEEENKPIRFFDPSYWSAYFT